MAPPEPKIAPDPTVALEELALEYRHVKAEHERHGKESSFRRRHAARLAEIEVRFESLLNRSVRDDEIRRRWRAHLHHGSAAPHELHKPAP